jgi:hypothetical protein
MVPHMTTILIDDNVTICNANVKNNELWIEQKELEKTTGWSIKPEGFCQGNTCIPYPKTETETFMQGSEINVSSFWNLMDRPILHDESGDTWMLGTSHKERLSTLNSLKAPNFSLPGLDGKSHSLSDYKGKRVFLTTWSSW